MRRLAFCAAFAGRVYLNLYLAGLLVLLLCLAVGWKPVLITSGSMLPTLRPGDIVINTEPPATPVRNGAVITFDDPSGEERLLTHRVVRLEEDGSYRTKGDANPAPDSTTIRPADVRGLGRVVLPRLAAPVVWAAKGRVANLAAWGLFTGLCAAAAVLHARGSRPQTAVATSALEGAATASSDPVRAPDPVWTAADPARRSARHAGRAIVALMTGVAIALAVIPARASFVGQTPNAENRWRSLQLAPPTELSAMSGCVETTPTVQLNWTATTTTSAEGYALYRAADGGQASRIATLDGTSSTSYQDSTVASGSYTYTLSTVLGTWESRSKAEVTVLVASC